MVKLICMSTTENERRHFMSIPTPHINAKAGDFAMKLAAGAFPDIAGEVTADTDISELMPGLDLPVQFTLTNKGTSVIQNVTVSIGAQSKEFTGLNLRQNTSTNLLMNYDVPEGTVQDEEYSVTSGSITLGSGTLTLNFTTASSITAGKPYIVRWEKTSGSVIEPVFNDVTVSSTTPTPITSADGKVTFVGQYSPFKIGDVANGDDGNLNEIIMMGSGSTLGYSKNTRTLNCFRAHFYVKSDGGTAGARCFVMNFEEGTQTGICHTDFTDLTDHADAWYSLDGRKLNSQPTKKGVYIQNGKKVVIR